MENKHAVIYARFSPRPKMKDGKECLTESNDMQVEVCKKHCEKMGYKVRGVYTDEHASGSSFERPGMWGAVERLKRGDVLLVWKHDRLARDVYVSEHMQRAVRAAGCTVESVVEGVDETPEQEMMRQIIQVFSNYERKMIKARTSMAMRRHQATGRRMSKVPPYGWVCDPDDDKRLVPDQHQQDVIRHIVRLHEDGAGCRDIARQIGQTEPGSWHHEKIRRILKRADSGV